MKAINSIPQCCHSKHKPSVSLFKNRTGSMRALELTFAISPATWCAPLQAQLLQFVERWHWPDSIPTSTEQAQWDSNQAACAFISRITSLGYRVCPVVSKCTEIVPQPAHSLLTNGALLCPKPAAIHTLSPRSESTRSMKLVNLRPQLLSCF